MALEEEFGTEISDAAAEQMRTPRDVNEWLVTAQERGELFRPPPSRKSGWLVTIYACSPDPAVVRPRLSRDEIAGAVRRIVLEQVGIRPEQYREDGRFVEDFGMD